MNMILNDLVAAVNTWQPGAAMFGGKTNRSPAASDWVLRGVILRWIDVELSGTTACSRMELAIHLRSLSDLEDVSAELNVSYRTESQSTYIWASM